MVINQGDILKVNLNPNLGHEQAGIRPVVVISNAFFNKKTNLVVVCPISNTKNRFPLHIPLDSRTKTTGSILCQHTRSLDLKARNFTFIERIPKDILENIIDVVFSEIEII